MKCFKNIPKRCRKCKKDQRYHSYNACDRQFGTIKQAAKLYENIETPDRWFNIIKNAKQKPPPFTMTKMGMEDFICVSELSKVITNRKIDVDKMKVNWLKIRKITYDREQPTFIFAFDNSYKQQRIDIKKRKTPEDALEKAITPLFNPAGRSVTAAKFNDIMELIEFIAPQYRSFYKRLQQDFNNFPPNTFMYKSFELKKNV